MSVTADPIHTPTAPELETLETLWSSLHVAPFAISVCDTQRHVLRANDELLTLLGVATPDEIIGHTYDRFHVAHDDDPEPALRARLLAGEIPSYRAQRTVQRPDGTRRHAIMRSWAPQSMLDDQGRPTVVVRAFEDDTARVEAEQALRDSEERFRLAQQHSSVGLALLSPEGRWLEVNPALCRITGYSEEQLRQITFREITHPDDLDLDLRHVERLVAGEIDGYELEKRYLHADGHVVWANLYGTAARHPDGTVRYFIAQVQDITERKRSQQLLDTFFDNSPDLLSVADFEGHLERLNRAWTDTLGWTQEEIASNPFLDLVHPDDVPATIAAYEAEVDRGEHLRAFRNRYRCKDGSYRWLEWNTATLPDLGVTIGNTRDVTDQVCQAEQLEDQRVELQRSNGELENFAYVVSHDLSEPLRVISGFLELLQDEFPETMPETAETYVAYIQDGARRMRRLIEDLLTFSRVGRLDGTEQEVDLDEVADEVRGMFATELQATASTLEIDPLPTVVMRRAQAVQLLQNLVGNALKFRRPDLPAHIHVHAATDGGAPVLLVDDDGIGVEPRHRERIFKIFQRLHTREEYDGTGIGLAICRKIVDGWGGDLVADDSPLGGTRFRLTLPARTTL